ncbi:hypothetical protein L1987_70194 [Smallanthus sonchifolius]|uniref:Uncharacterized protein n=1 Tax=Smallanthus sonchifolius TaxID=185202 RepID=A0ACB9AT73_9ASTR|nr:hypothetical protein L1987_70194 [Smallanthus sonchifolius]
MGETDGYEKGKTCADMLKNTASNISRLADEIHQCEGRKKYLAYTRSPSDGGDVRWYFRKVPMEKNEVAAAVPRAETVEKSDYFRFSMRDSLAIEASFLQQEENLLSIWWKEYAECSEGPKGSPASISQSDPLLKPFPLEDPKTGKPCFNEEERVGVPVKGGLYEVDLVRRQCFPIYWDGDNRRVLRGHWFARKGSLDWLPLREDISEQLEFAYHGRGLHGLFTGEDDTWEAWLNVDASGISSIVKFGGKGIKLRRGYAPSKSPKPTQDELRQRKEEEMDDYCSQVPVQHLVFMVHGIGQRLEKANLIDDVGIFRHITSSLAEQHLTSYQRRTQRILFIPCQWRKNLRLSGESAVEKCTLPGLRGLRVTLSATVHDVLYYMSPIYCQDIIDSVSNQLNKLYLKFLKRNPGYDGKISLYGHSLGSVLSYDILCHQETLTSPFPMEWIYKDNLKYESCKSFNEIVTMDPKKFDSATLDQVDLGVDHDQSEMVYGKEDGSDDCKNMDGEVLACGSNQIDEDVSQHDENTTVKSLRDEIDRLNARIKELESNKDKGICGRRCIKFPRGNESHELSKAKHDAIDGTKSQSCVTSSGYVMIIEHDSCSWDTTRRKMLALCHAKDGDVVGGATPEKPEVVERSYGSVMLETLTGSEDGRIDHVLQDKTFQHQYISDVGAHTSYWKDLDTALFVLKHLYRDIPEEPEEPNEFMENEINQRISDWNGWYDDEELAEEELPLTFSNNKYVKRFTRRAKSFIGP